MNKFQGFTLTELMLTIAILITVTGITLPSFKDFIHQQKVISSTNQMVGRIQQTRTMALNRGVEMTLCATSDGHTCIRNWQKKHMIFHDANNNRKRDKDEQLHYIFDEFPQETKITWRAFQNKRQLVFAANGATAAQNGTFRICSEINAKFNKAIIVNYSGRPRLSEDANGDGYDEDRKGKKIVCR